MTLKEFKVWLDGFCEAVNGNPTPLQWEKIKVKLAQEVEKNQAEVNAKLHDREIDRKLARAPLGFVCTKSDIQGY